MLLMWALLLLLMGPQFVRNDLRRDQGMLALLRTLPVRGYEVILGASGAAALTLASACHRAAACWSRCHGRKRPAAAARRASGAWLVAAVLVIGPVSFAGILLQNAAVILLPDWSRMTARRGTATSLGTNLANSALTILLLGLLRRCRGRWRLGCGGSVMAEAWMPVLCAAVIAVVLGAECWGMVKWLGARFESLELWSEQPMPVQFYFVARPREGARAAASRVEDQGTVCLAAQGRCESGARRRRPRAHGTLHGHAHRHDHRRVRADRQGLDRHRETSDDRQALHST